MSFCYSFIVKISPGSSIRELQLWRSWSSFLRLMCLENMPSLNRGVLERNEGTLPSPSGQRVECLWEGAKWSIHTIPSGNLRCVILAVFVLFWRAADFSVMSATWTVIAKLTGFQSCHSLTNQGRALTSTQAAERGFKKQHYLEHGQLLVPKSCSII